MDLSNIKALRYELNLSQKEVASAIGLDNTLYNKYENDYNTIPIKHLNTLVNFFDVSIDYVFQFNTIKQYDNSKKEIDKTISGDRLKLIRKENKLTQEKLAKLLNISRTAITEYERGTNTIATSFLYSICKNYNLSADYLLGKIDEPKYLN